MNTVEAHYDRLLAEHYTWMKGGFAAMLEGARRFIAAHHLGASRTDAIAVDLGCGPGAFSIALAEAGYSVVAIDSSRRLLEELERSRGALPITSINDDLLTFPDAAPQADLIVCMGDTLPHLPSRAAVRDLFALCAAALRTDGRLVLEFRDLTGERAGIDRFIPVGGDGDRILTCFLEYQPDRVMVHDLLHLREGGEWKLHASAYPKLRLNEESVLSDLETTGFAVEESMNRNGVDNDSGATMSGSDQRGAAVGRRSPWMPDSIGKHGASVPLSPFLIPYLKLFQSASPTITAIG